MAPDAPAFGPVTINRLIRLASLTLAVFAARRADAVNANEVKKAREFEAYVRGDDQ